MYQIDNSTAATTMPQPTSPGTPGFFTDGNPATGTPPTIFPAEFANAVMLEILGVLSAAGVAPEKNKYDQLSTAIGRIINNKTAVFAPINSPALTGTPTAPTPAQSDSSTKLATTAFVKSMVGTDVGQIPDMSAFGASLAGNGYQQLPGGLILQWGMAVTSNATVVTFPIAFPHQVLRVLASASMGNITVGIGGGNQTSCPISTYNAANGVATSSNTNWVAIGY